MCSELLPARIAGGGGAQTVAHKTAEGNEAADWSGTLHELGIETVYMGADYDFSVCGPPKGYLQLSPTSLLKLLVMRAERETGGAEIACTCMVTW
jgi:hypothetical protein